MSAIRTLASTEKPLFSRATISAAASASMSRCFLHEYCSAKDPKGNVLELIMTAPLVVTNWIGLQYFSSVVDNQAFGSGSKVIHDVLGQFGSVDGNDPLPKS